MARRYTSKRSTRSSKSSPRRKRITTVRSRGRRTRARAGGAQVVKIVLQHQQMPHDPLAQQARDLGLSVEPSVPRRAPF